MIINDVCKIVELVEPLLNDKFNKKHSSYMHMGATISDAILQAGLNYKSVVYPRISNIIKNYGDYDSTTDFIILFQTIPLSEILKWRSDEKLNRIKDLTWLLYDSSVECEDDLAEWILNTNSISALLSIHGIGDKTIDYLKKLVGIDAIPIDRHLFRFLNFAGVETNDYKYAQELYVQTSVNLGISKIKLDDVIWEYMSRL